MFGGNNASGQTQVVSKKVLSAVNWSMGAVIGVLCLLLVSVIIAFAITAIVFETKEGFGTMTGGKKCMRGNFSLDPGFNIENNMCSKACCGPTYGPRYGNEPDQRIVDAVKNGDFIPNNMYCNNSYQDAGCMCLTKKQAGVLATRGGNAPY